MAAAISESHPLRRLFSGLVKQTFFITLPSSTSTQRFFARRFLRQGKAQNDSQRAKRTTCPVSEDCFTASKTRICSRTCSGLTANSAPLVRTS